MEVGNMSFSQERYSLGNRHDIKEEICADVIQYPHLPGEEVYE